MSKISAYFSHSIRGKKGNAATKEYMDENCEKAKKVADWLRKNVPDLELYVPAEHEEFIQIVYVDKYLTEEQILDIDCRILEKKDFLIVLEVNGWRGGGIGIEIVHAKGCGIPIFYLIAIDETTLSLLERFIGEVLEMKKTALLCAAEDAEKKAEALRKEAAKYL